MKIEIEISENEIKEELIKEIASRCYNSLGYDFRDKLRDKIMDKIDWSKMTPIVQELILKMAAEKIFGVKK